MKWTRDNFWISDDHRDADIEFIIAELHRSYWAAERSRETIEKSVSNSVMFSLYDNDRPVGFARVVTDWTTFAWLCDVWICEAYRGRGLGVWLMKCLLEHPSTAVTRNLLATRDAHGLYEKFGFRTKDCMLLKK
jgi:GNAT superfamily N-acetyltransferase